MALLVYGLVNEPRSLKMSSSQMFIYWIVPREEQLRKIWRWAAYAVLRYCVPKHSQTRSIPQVEDRELLRTTYA